MSILRLAVPTPLRRHFDYLPPAELTPEQVSTLCPGVRLLVPFGKRELTAWLIEVRPDSDQNADSLRPALRLLDTLPLLPPESLALCQWAAQYYHHAAGEVIQAAFPKRLRRGDEHQRLGIPAWRLTQRGKGLPADALQRSPKQATALSLLQHSDSVSAAELKSRDISAAVLKALADKTLIERCTQSVQAREIHYRDSLNLSQEQARAVQAVDNAAGAFSAHLLEGVTGSGKTEVYLQLIEARLKAGQQVLVLIPEIGLTPQTLGRFERRFDTDIAVFHSGLADGERYRAWEAARDGTARIVIGTRSAVFTPMLQLGLIIVDEEHDLSYKQSDGFRYSARDVAVKRGHLATCPVLLGSATPSLESLHNALSGRYQHHLLTERAGAGTLPDISVLDVRKQALQGGLSKTLLETVAATLQRGEQVMLFLNRRGYAPSLQCHDCGWLAECKACDARMTVHRRQRRLRCHHCAAQNGLPNQCPNCHSNQLLTAGLGTEQTEEILHRHFSAWPVHRVDSDSMKSRSAMAELVEHINEQQPCILLGTQMLTKGHHFPGVSLVAVIDADAMLFSTDFRGEERMAQLLTQVAGRAGREQHKGKVLLQTHYPDHPVLQAMISQSYGQQARQLLKQRQETGLPPAGQMVLLRSDCREAAVAEQFLTDLRLKLQAELPAGYNMIGPLPSPMPRRAGQYRFQLTLLTTDRSRAQYAASRLVAIGESLPVRKGMSWSLDIDPQEVF
jgi:primosomal protein N' (replication factor Y) (superfamily II helicase)